MTKTIQLFGYPQCAPGPDPSQGWELSKHFEVLNKQEMGVKHGKPSKLLEIYGIWYLWELYSTIFKTKISVCLKLWYEPHFMAICMGELTINHQNWRHPMPRQNRMETWGYHLQYSRHLRVASWVGSKAQLPRLITIWFRFGTKFLLRAMDFSLSNFSLRPPKEWNERAERTPSPLRRMDWWAAACFQQTHGFPEECVWLTRCVSHQFIGMSVSTQEMMNSEVLVKGFGRNEFINVHQCSWMFMNVHQCSSYPRPSGND